MKKRHALFLLAPGVLVGVIAAIMAIMPMAVQASGGGPFLGHHVSVIGSTVPSNGDVNPYGIVTAPTTTGKLTQGNILISNFNAVSNLQGTGTTVVQLTPGGSLSVFAQLNVDELNGDCPGGVG